MDIRTTEIEQLSWRDPSGYVARMGERICRAVGKHKVAQLNALMESSWYRNGVVRGWFPDSRWLTDEEAALFPEIDGRWLEHRALDFPCYPHEITALQLHDAARLTLAIATEALANGWMIKDASAWNVLFERGSPRFCDILSFEPVDDSGIWQAYAQFCRHFINPLLIHGAMGVRTGDLFLLHRDGVEPGYARQMLRGWRGWRQPALECVTLPALFSRSAVRSRAGARPAAARNPELARYVLGRTLKRLQKHVDKLVPTGSGAPTQWQNYESDRDHYTADALAEKRAFVAQAVDRDDIRTVLDLGCNAGEFSKVAAAAGKTVVAADFDEGALSRLYASIRQHDTAIAPVLLDIGRPTPAVGWMNREVASFLDRARGHFDCIFALGLVHHLLVSERATLAMIREFFDQLAPAYLVLEWIPTNDRRFAEIAGINKTLYSDLSVENFENVFSEGYQLRSKRELGSGGRVLYVWQRTV